MTDFEKIYQFIKKPQVIIFYLLALTLVFYFIDKPIALYFYHLDLRTKATILQILSLFGQYNLYIALLFFLGIFFRYIKKNPTYEARSWYLLLLLLILITLNFVLKISFGRARPELLFLNNEYGFYWFKFTNLYWSFPSGHTTVVTGLALGLGLIFPRYFFLYLGLAFLVIASRVVLYNHYLSDVLFAFYLNLLVVGLLGLDRLSFKIIKHKVSS